MRETFPPINLAVDAEPWEDESPVGAVPAQDVAHLTQQLSAAVAQLGEAVVELGRLKADTALVWQLLRRQGDRLQFLEKALADVQHLVQPLQALVEMGRKDKAVFDRLDGILLQATSGHARETRTQLRGWLARWMGRLEPHENLWG
jgi:hypothetical protein